MLLPFALTLVVSLLLGLPIALFTRRPGEGWPALLGEGLVFGFVAFALAPTLFAWIGVAGLVLFAVLWIAVAVIAIARRPPWPGVVRMTRSGIAVLVLAVLIAVVALLFRLHNDNFIMWVGDMGAYVNWANEFARTGVLSATWPPLLSSYLALASWTFGAASTTASLGVAGLILIVATCRVLNLMGANRWVLLLVAGCLAVNLHAIWYSNFPSSEALDAPMYVAWLATVVGAIKARNRVPWLAMNGATMLALGLTRGSGPFLLLPLVILAICTLRVERWRFLARPVWQLLAAGVAGSMLAFWYGISRIALYYVDIQFRSLVPAVVANLLQRTLHVFDPTPVTAIALIVIEAVLVFVAWRLVKPAEKLPPVDGVTNTRAPRLLAIVLASLLVLGIAAAAIVGAAGWNILLRIGLEYTILAIVCIAFVGRRRIDETTAALVLLVGAVAAFFIGLQTARLLNHEKHAFYLYWDRYFFSEVLPSLFVLTGLALVLLVAEFQARGWWRPRLALTSVRVVAVAVLVAAVAATQAPQLALISSDTYMKGAYSLDKELAGQVPNQKIPVLWTSTSTRQIRNFFFPNTWLAFGQPLSVSFGDDVLYLNRNNFLHDQVASPEVVGQALSCASATSMIVLESDEGGKTIEQRVSPNEFTVTRLKTVSRTVSLLSQPPRHGTWQHLKFTVTAYRVTATGTLPTCRYPGS